MIVFMMHTCRRLRNLAKQRSYLGNAANGLMFAGLLLLKKGILLNQQAESTLYSRKNLFKINQFDTFLNTNNANKILHELNKDTKLYFTLIQHLQKKLEQEVGLRDPSAKSIHTLTMNSNTSMEQVQPELRQQSLFLIEFQNARGNSLPEQINSDLKTALGHLWLATTNDINFPFLKEGVPFDWRQFEVDIRSRSKIENVLRGAY